MTQFSEEELEQIYAEAITRNMQLYMNAFNHETIQFKIIKVIDQETGELQYFNCFIDTYKSNKDIWPEQYHFRHFIL